MNLLEQLRDDAWERDATFKEVHIFGEHRIESTTDDSTHAWQLSRHWKGLDIGDVTLEDLGDWHKVTLTLNK
jgi:hypothetical protein